MALGQGHGPRQSPMECFAVNIIHRAKIRSEFGCALLSQEFAGAAFRIIHTKIKFDSVPLHKVENIVARISAGLGLEGSFS